MTTILPGSYKAKIVNYGVTLAQSGNPQVTITFNVFTTDDHSLGTNMQWWGSLYAGAKKFTLEALEVCGLRSPNHLGLLPKGKDGGALDTNRLVLVKVEQKEGKKFPEIRWINPIDGKKFKDAVNENDFEVFLAKSGLKADFAQIAHENGIEVKDETYSDKQQSKTPEVDPFEGIPF